MKHSETVAVAIDKIWKSYDKEQMWEGYELLRQAAEREMQMLAAILDGAIWGRNLSGAGRNFP